MILAWWQNLPLFLILCPLMCGVACSALHGKAARCAAAVMTAAESAGMAMLLWFTASGNVTFTYAMGEIGAPFGNELRAGSVEALMGLAFSLVLMLSLIGGNCSLIEDVEPNRMNLFGTMIGLLTAAMAAIVFTNDLFTAYVFIEITTLSACSLIGVTNRGKALFSSARYMVMNLLGSGLFLLGLSILYTLTGHLLFPQLGETVRGLTAQDRYSVPLYLSFLLMTMGLCIKSALYPFHTWLPDAYSNATAVSGALLSSLVSKLYIFLLIKIYWRAVGLDVIRALPVSKILFVLGLCGMVFGSVSALRANNINRMVAFSSAAQIGYIYMGIGIGGMAGFSAAVFHIYCHAVTKSLLFITTPRLAEVSGDSLLFSRLQGSGLRDPNSGIFFTVGSLSMVGIPIFAGFSSKLLFATAAVGTGSFRKVILVMLILAVSSLLNAFYFIHTVIRIYTVYGSDYLRVRERGHHSLDYNTAAVILTACNLFLGLFSWVITDLIQKGFLMFS